MKRDKQTYSKTNRIASEMAQEEKVTTSITYDNLHSIPWSHLVERDK